MFDLAPRAWLDALTKLATGSVFAIAGAAVIGLLGYVIGEQPGFGIGTITGAMAGA